jgi:hypothetical protein
VEKIASKTEISLGVVYSQLLATEARMEFAVSICVFGEHRVAWPWWLPRSWRKQW